jgi:hypothetical protein
MPVANSSNSAEEASVERDGVVAVLPRQRAPTAAHEPPPTPPPVAHARSDHAFVGVLSAVTSLLAARLLLLLSIGGAFVLAVMAMRDGGYAGLAVLISFCGLTVIPMTYLDVVTHRRGGM